MFDWRALAVIFQGNKSSNCLLLCPAWLRIMFLFIFFLLLMVICEIMSPVST